MSEEKIRLQVPVDVPEGFPEYVEQGYLSATLKPGEVVEVESRPFANWLVRELGLVDLTPEDDAGEPPAFPADFPDNFPRREIFTGQELSVEDLRGKSRDELIALPGVGEKTADAIMEYFAAEAAAGDENDTDGGDE